MSSNAIFCEGCGQKKIKPGLNIFDLFKDFITNIFNLDGRLFRSLKHLWRPAFLAKEYISGRRKNYVNPIRFFLAMLVLLFFLLNHSMNSEAFDEGTMKEITKIKQKKLAQIYDSTVCVVSPNMSIEEEEKLRESIFGMTEEGSAIIWAGGNFLGWKMKGYEVTRYDAYSMDTDSLFAKYKLINWYDQLFIRQLIKIDKDRSGSAAYFVSNLLWGVILYIVLVALLMKLLFIRNVYYYVEHLIVFILYTAKMLLLINLMFLIQLLELDIPLQNILATLTYIFILVYFVITIKNYYRQSIWIILIKSITIIISSFYLIILSVLVVSLISLAFL